MPATRPFPDAYANSYAAGASSFGDTFRERDLVPVPICLPLRDRHPHASNPKRNALP